MSSPGTSDWQTARRSLAQLETSRVTGRWLLGIGALVIAGVLVVLSALLLTVNLGRLNDTTQWVRHTNNVLTQISTVREGLFEAEAAGRAYVLGGGQRALRRSRDVAAEIDRSVVELAQLVADNPLQARRLADMRPYIADREGRLRKLLALGPDRLDAAVALTREQTAYREKMGDTVSVRVRLEEMRETEIALLSMRQEQARQQANFAFVLALVVAAIAAGTAALGVATVRRENARSRARETEITQVHTQRLSLMGQTALAIAHELNQPLSAAGNYMSAAARFLNADTPPEQVNDTVEKANLQVRRAGEILKRLRNFVSHADRDRAEEKPEDLLADAVALLGTIDDSVSMVRDVARDLPPVFVDRIEIQQVLVNLMRNAIEAMHGQQNRLMRLSAVEQNGFVVFRLQDNGPGLPKHLAGNLFVKPVRSSKSGSMGVGLSISHRIVAEHGGRIWAEAAPGGGTTFSFTIPAMEDAVARAAE